MSRLPEVKGDNKTKKKFKLYPISYFHIDIAEVKTEKGKLYIFVAIVPTSKFVYVELLPRCTKTETAQFLRNLIKAIPYRIHTILTDNGIQFTNRIVDKHAMTIISNLNNTYMILSMPTISQKDLKLLKV